MASRGTEKEASITVPRHIYGAPQLWGHAKELLVGSVRCEQCPKSPFSVRPEQLVEMLLHVDNLRFSFIKWGYIL